MAQDRIDPNAITWTGAGAAKDARESRKDEASINQSQVSTSRTAALTPAEVKKAELDAELAEYKVREARTAEEEKGRAEQVAKDAQSTVTRKFANVIAAAAEARRKSQEGWFATGFGSPTARMVSESTPAGAVAALVDTIQANTAFAEIKALADAGVKLTPISNVDVQMLGASVANLDPAKGSPEDFQRRMDVIINTFGGEYKRLGGDPAAIGQSYEVLAGQPLPKGLLPKAVTEGFKEEPAAATPAAPTESPSAVKTGGGEKFVTEDDKRTAARLQAAFDAGATKGELNTLAQELGAAVDPKFLDEVVTYRDKGGKGATFVPQERERSIPAQIIGEAADSAAGAYAINAADAATLGLMNEAIGAVGGEEAGERARFAQDYSSETSPTASMLGSLSGGIAASIPAVRGAQALLPALSATRAAIAGEAALGAATGAGQADEGSRLAGAAIGGTLGAAGGALPGAAARVLKPRTPDAVRAMREAGVDMSVGQTLGVPNAEAAAAAFLPGGGDLTLRAQRKAFDDFQTAYLNDALGNINARLPDGLKPTKRMEEAQKAFDQAYGTARSGMRVVPDGDMWRDIAAFRQRLGGDEFSEDAAKRLDKLLVDQIQRRVQGPTSGDEYKSLASLLGKRRAAFAKQGNAEMADGVADLQRILDGNARRHSAPEAVDLLDRADRGYSILTRAEDAARSTTTAPGEFTPQLALNAVQRGDISARNRAFARGDARGQAVAEQGLEALGKKPPGDVSRLERAVGTAGGIFGGPVSLPANVLMGAANAPGIRPVLNTMIAGQRPQSVQRLADLIRRRPEYLAALGGSSALASDAVRDRPRSMDDLRHRYGYGGYEELPKRRTTVADFYEDVPDLEKYLTKEGQ